MKDPFRKEKPKGKTTTPCCLVGFTWHYKDGLRCSSCDRRYALTGSLSDLDMTTRKENDEETVENSV